MERIIILGCGGAGKSTLARTLGEKTGIPVVHLDKLWWTGNWENVTREEFDEKLSLELAKPRWIMDGNYERTAPRRLAACDTAIFLDFPRWLCLWNMVKRVLKFYGRTRPDMGGSCPERFDREFVGWIWNFNRTKRPLMYDMLRTAENINVIVLKNRRQVKDFVKNL